MKAAILLLVIGIALTGCASVNLYEDKKTGAKTDFAVKGPRAVVEHTF